MTRIENSSLRIKPENRIASRLHETVQLGFGNGVGRVATNGKHC
jgi:hypothetical protein